MGRPDFSYRADPAVPDFRDDRPLIIFDGECGFCSGWVQFFLKRDTKAAVRFASAQSLLGTALLKHYGFATDDYETSLLLKDGKPYFKAEGGIRALAALGFPWSLLLAGLVVPEFLRDHVYDIIARNRMKIGGRLQSCFLPSPEQRGRFLS
ncbi:thiol-disulfide oxidoreductase DCC family protein [Pararhizobium sp.]|uniref:thiol-disulfide oxidoreductase DCC family protein n=1 Tax=Pararhizobium sp. TaxID=1977563 RepID=UPI00271E9793|nr:DCC1-like thiol-disulfide oxidoreductase family protein [Pararhizobium sp.]MDO9415811.1 DCC1-like thiol-disulfide oxidoreductase family protein [Pararhizobium sp.]